MKTKVSVFFLGVVCFLGTSAAFGQQVRQDVGTKLLVPSSARTGTFTSFLAVLNLDTQPNNVTITARRENGSTIGQRSHSRSR